jgi:hypothetical protein
MFRASAGGGDVARSGRRVYRHSLVELLIRLLGRLPAGAGWSAAALAIAAIHMSWDPGPTLGQRFESARTLLDQALPRRRRVGRTYQGFVKALSRRGSAIRHALVRRLRERTRLAAGSDWRIGRWVPIGVDGSRFDAPRTVANEALGIAGRDKSGPQIMGVLLVHLGVMLPWAFARAGARAAERTLLRSLLGVLPADTLLVADAGFTGFELLNELRHRGAHFLVRVGRGITLLAELGYARREGRSTVYLWPDEFRSRPPLTLRLIRVGEVYLVTDVTNPCELSKKTAAELYRRRWGLEVAFRTLKQTLEHRKVRSGTPRHALAELDWAVLGLWALGLLGVEALRSARERPRRLSFALALRAVRHAARTNPAPRTLRGRLRRAVADEYRRKGKKRAYRWPHKKNPPPPGAPVLTKATPRQIREAAALVRRSHGR